MSLLDAILNANGGAAVEQVASQFGLGSGQATQALSALVPAIAAGVHQNAQTSGGLADLMSALASGQHQQYVNDPSTLAQPSTIADGNGILGHVFGSAQTSQQVAAAAAAHTGLSPEVLQSMLPIAASLVMGALANHANNTSTSPSGGGMLGGLLGGGAGGSLLNVLSSTLTQASGSGGLGGLLGRLMNG